MERRSLISWLFMLCGLAVSYGAGVFYALRFLYPSRNAVVRQLYVAAADSIRPGQSLSYTLPSGAKVAVTRTVKGLVALSNTCPHLGCKVHWEGEKNRFLCPCHDGVFDPEGNPVSGPPASEGTPLGKYEIAEKDGQVYLVFEEV